MSETEKPLIVSIDDDLDISILLKSWLNNFSYEFVSYQEPETFLKSIKTTKPDLCIIDINIGAPGVGYKIISAIRNVFGRTPPIMILSSEAESHSIAHGIDLGADDYLIKPTSKNLFLEKIQFCLKLARFENNVIGIVPEEYRQVKILVDVMIDEIDDFGIKIQGVEILPKGSAILLKSGFLQEIYGSNKPIMGTVISNWVNPGDRSAGAYIEFDQTNEKFLTIIRGWIRDQKNMNSR